MGTTMTSEELREAVENGRFKRKRTHTFDPTYMSDKFQEYLIVPDGTYWRIRKYGGGWLGRSLKGKFTSFKAAEDTLIRNLRKNNRLNNARYPGCPIPRRTSYTELFLKDYSQKQAR